MAQPPAHLRAMNLRNYTKKSNVNEGALVLARATVVQETLISDEMGSEIIQIGIGKLPTKFSIHKDLIGRTGDFINAILNKPLAPGKLLVWPEEDPVIFKLFVEYLYSRNVPAVTTTMTRGAQAARVSHLCQLYSFLEKYQVKFDIRNKVMDRIQNGFAILGMLPEPRIIIAIYQHTSQGSPLRKFCAESMVYYLHSSKYVADGLVADLLQQREFANEFLEAIRSSKAGEHHFDPRIRDCEKSMSCVECAGDFGRLEGKEGLFPCHFHKHTGLINGVEFNDDACYLWKP